MLILHVAKRICSISIIPKRSLSTKDIIYIYSSSLITPLSFFPTPQKRESFLCKSISKEVAQNKEMLGGGWGGGKI
jgi:hypothetical protein